ncbi:MAG TPA: four helix bundle protein [Planctomycetota bacterium]
MNLKAWQAAYGVGREIYDLASSLPHPHLFGLGGQLQRAAISFPTNIAEGFGRRRSRDKAHFYTVARSSGDELKCLLLFARDGGLLLPDRFEALITRVDEACRLTYGLIESMNRWLDP